MIICPKCECEWDDNLNYCKNCGTYLHNYCSNPDCTCNVNIDEPVEFESHDCFCSECGSETTFYKQKLIKINLD